VKTMTTTKFNRPNRSPFWRLSAFLVASLFLASCGSSDSSDSSDDIGDNRSCGKVVKIGTDEKLKGKLKDGDCKIADLEKDSGDDSFADEYLIKLAAPVILTITMRSSKVDSFLHLANRSRSCVKGCNDKQLATVATDNNSGGGGGTDAQIVFNVPAAGTYIIVANSLRPETGAYSLETSTK